MKDSSQIASDTPLEQNPSRPVPELEDLLLRFTSTAPEVIFEWQDKETSAKGYLVINSLRGGAAGGGTRLRKGLTKEEILSLAQTMELKFTVTGPPIGGAKSGIDFDPSDPRKEEVLNRWFAAAMPLLKSYYGTGGDLNIDEIKEVIPITRKYGLLHPQEGIVTGHFQFKESTKLAQITRLQEGVSQVVTQSTYTPQAGPYTVAHLITGYGVAEAVKHYYQLWQNQGIENKRVIIQGWGNVAAATAFYLAQEGARIVGIIDRRGGILNKEGLSLEKVRTLFLQRQDNALYDDQICSFEETEAQIWDIGADIFVPAAASRLVTKNHAKRMIDQGLEVIACGANVAFAEEEIFYGSTTQFVDDRVALLPDFIANSAMARVFAYLMSNNSKGQVDTTHIFSDCSSAIFEALEKIHSDSSKPRHITRIALYKALNQLTQAP